MTVAAGDAIRSTNPEPGHLPGVLRHQAGAQIGPSIDVSWEDGWRARARPMDHTQHLLYANYDALWEEARPIVMRGDAVLDECAFRKGDDRRRGLTVIARLGSDTVRHIEAFLESMRALEPEQYFYPPVDIHLTILSLFTATEDAEPLLARTDAYRAAVDSALAGARAFTLETIGVALARDAVLAQGFPHGDGLTRIRNRLREALMMCGLDGGLDRRYRLSTAHNTVIRFAAPLREPGRFVAELAKHRDRYFGRSTIARLDLAVTDWYMSSERVVLLQSYALDSPNRRRKAGPSPRS